MELFERRNLFAFMLIIARMGWGVEIFEENIPAKIDDILFSLKPLLGEVYYSEVLNDLFT